MLVRGGKITPPSPSSRNASSMAAMASAIVTLAQTSSCRSSSTMSVLHAGEARLDRDAGLPRRVDSPVDFHGLVELTLAQQPEIFGYGAAPVFKIAGAHPLHAEHLDRQRRMGLERIREQHALAFDHLPE